MRKEHVRFCSKNELQFFIMTKKRRLLFFEAVAIQKERHKNCLKICLMNWWANRKFLQKIKTERRSEPRRHEKSIMIYSGILPIMLCCVSFKAIKYGLDLKGETKVIVRIFLLIFGHNFLHHLQQKKLNQSDILLSLRSWIKCLWDALKHW